MKLGQRKRLHAVAKMHILMYQICIAGIPYGSAQTHWGIFIRDMRNSKLCPHTGA